MWAASVKHTVTVLQHSTIPCWNVQFHPMETPGISLVPPCFYGCTHRKGGNAWKGCSLSPSSLPPVPSTQSNVILIKVNFWGAFGVPTWAKHLRQDALCHGGSTELYLKLCRLGQFGSSVLPLKRMLCREFRVGDQILHIVGEVNKDSSVDLSELKFLRWIWILILWTNIQGFWALIIFFIITTTTTIIIKKITFC